MCQTRSKALLTSRRTAGQNSFLSRASPMIETTRWTYSMIECLFWKPNRKFGIRLTSSTTTIILARKSFSNTSDDWKLGDWSIRPWWKLNRFFCLVNHNNFCLFPFGGVHAGSAIPRWKWIGAWLCLSLAIPPALPSWWCLIQALSSDLGGRARPPPHVERKAW